MNKKRFVDIKFYEEYKDLTFTQKALQIRDMERLAESLQRLIDNTKEDLAKEVKFKKESVARYGF